LRAALCLVFVALLLVGCGGDDSTSTGAGSDAGTGATAGAAEVAGGKTGSEGGTGNSSGPAPAGEKPGSQQGGSARPFVDPTPLPNEGEKAAAPGVPTTKGGDNSIQTFGDEGSSDERVEAAELVASYLDAGVAGDWKTACNALSGTLSRQFAVLAKQMHKPAAGACEGVLPQLASRTSPAALRAAADIHILSFRVEGERGFLIYEDNKGGVANFALVREDGEWKINSLAGYPLNS
jgi:hypothetical protein